MEGVACTPDGTLWLDVTGGLTHSDGTALEITDPEVTGSYGLARHGEMLPVSGG